MKKFKKVLAISLSLAMVLAFVAACAGDPEPTPAPEPEPAAEEPAAEPEPTPEPEDPPADPPAGVGDDPHVVLTYAEVNPIDSLMGSTAAEFKRLVEELSEGSITINIQAGGVLGQESDVLDGMMGGVGMVDMSRISAFGLTPFGAEYSTLLTIPFTFEGRDHFWAFADSDLAYETLMEPHNIGLGVRGLFYLEEGFRHFFTTSPIGGMEDLAGLNLRVPGDPIMVGMVESIGATATTLSFTELYSGLSTGVVDGAEQPIVNYLANSFHEVAPYMILNAHTLGAAQVIMTDEAWNRLTENQQAVIMEAGRLASAFNRNLSEQFENEAIEQLLEEGATFIPVDDVQQWRDAAASVIAQFTAGFEERYQAILNMAN